jgi:hypothetical protein
MPLPLAIDANMMRDDLVRWGWNDYKIEVAIGASGGYMAKLRQGRNMGYSMAARLFNLWEYEAQKRTGTTPAAPSYIAPIQGFASTLATA